MTDNEIIKALEEYVKENKFEYFHNNMMCIYPLIKNALDLIKRQKAEIERLEKVQVQYVKAYFDEFAERLKNDFRLAQLDIGLTSAVVDELVETMNSEFNTLADFTDLIKTEANIEFAERLKAVSRPHPHLDTRMVFELQIDNLLKEMVGES